VHEAPHETPHLSKTRLPSVLRLQEAPLFRRLRLLLRRRRRLVARDGQRVHRAGVVGLLGAGGRHDRPHLVFRIATASGSLADAGDELVIRDVHPADQHLVDRARADAPLVEAAQHVDQLALLLLVGVTTGADQIEDPIVLRHVDVRVGFLDAREQLSAADLGRGVAVIATLDRVGEDLVHLVRLEVGDADRLVELADVGAQLVLVVEVLRVELRLIVRGRGLEARVLAVHAEQPEHEQGGDSDSDNLIHGICPLSGSFEPSGC
jgi:hypothetical protein